MRQHSPAGDEGATFAISMAFQPIVRAQTQTVYAYEALVRGPQGQSAASILSRLTEASIPAFDRHCRIRAMHLAKQLGLLETEASLSINFLTRSMVTPEDCSAMALRSAVEQEFPPERLIFEVTESERVLDPQRLSLIVRHYQQHGFRIALPVDNLGSSQRRPIRTDIVKLDMALTRNLHLRPRAQALIAAMRSACDADGTAIIAEGVESLEEYHALRRTGVDLMQGFLFAVPALETLPKPRFP